MKNQTHAPARKRPGTPFSVIYSAPVSASNHHNRRSRATRSGTLLVGCGDVGLRLLARSNLTRLRIVATCRRTEQAQAIRELGATPLQGDLADKRFMQRVAALRGSGLIWMAPPPATGTRDPLTRRMLAALAPRLARALASASANRHGLAVCYVSTTGVYGDRQGQWTYEHTPTRPANARAIRRVDAELGWRGRLADAPALSGLLRSACILRAPGIYAADRLPVDRLRAGTPAICRTEDAWSNHIHADDLARLCRAARYRAQGRRVFNAVDHEPMQMGDYFDQVANRMGLPNPPRLPRAAVKALVSPMMWSFMSESRRISNGRLAELGVRLLYPTVASALNHLPPSG